MDTDRFWSVIESARSGGLGEPGGKPFDEEMSRRLPRLAALYLDELVA
ncbi:hypothetical protein [Streptomyces sp. NPDC005970]